MTLRWTDTEFEARMAGAATRRYSAFGARGEIVQGDFPGGIGKAEYIQLAVEPELRVKFGRLALAEAIQVNVTRRDELVFVFVLDGAFRGACGAIAPRALDFRVKHLMLRTSSDSNDIFIDIPDRCRNAYLELRVASSFYRRWLSNMGLDLPAPMLDALRANDGLVIYNDRWCARTNQCIELIDAEPLEDPFFFPWFHAKAYELLSLASRDVVQGIRSTVAEPVSRGAAQASLASGKSQRVQRAERILLGNLRHAPSIAQLARAVDMSATELKAAFRRHYGTSIHAYLKAARLERARVLLSRTRRSVYSIALEVGWHCQSRFAQAFREHTGAAPLAYRRVQRSA